MKAGSIGVAHHVLIGSVRMWDSPRATQLGGGWTGSVAEVVAVRAEGMQFCLPRVWECSVCSPLVWGLELPICPVPAGDGGQVASGHQGMRRNCPHSFPTVTTSRNA